MFVPKTKKKKHCNKKCHTAELSPFFVSGCLHCSISFSSNQLCENSQDMDRFSRRDGIGLRIFGSGEFTLQLEFFKQVYERCAYSPALATAAVGLLGRASDEAVRRKAAKIWLLGYCSYHCELVEVRIRKQNSVCLCVCVWKAIRVLPAGCSHQPVRTRGPLVTLQSRAAQTAARAAQRVRAASVDPPPPLYGDLLKKNTPKIQCLNFHLQI